MSWRDARVVLVALVCAIAADLILKNVADVDRDTRAAAGLVIFFVIASRIV